MKITELLNKKATFSFEIFPPKNDKPIESARELIEKLSLAKPDFISITYGAAGSGNRNTEAIAGVVETEFKITALSHLTCIGASREDIDKVLQELKTLGIENILALRGDLPLDAQKRESHFKYASELIEYINKNYDFCVGGACYPEGHPEAKNLDADIDNLKRKVDNGAKFLTTQLFFENDIYYNFVDKIRAKSINVPIFIGVMPITSAKQIKRICELSGSAMPKEYAKLIEKYGDDNKAMEEEGIIYATRQILDLLSNGEKHIHLYTMNKPETVIKIDDSLKALIN